VEALDGKQNTWTISNERAEPCLLGVEIVCGFRKGRSGPLSQPSVQINGRTVRFPVQLHSGQALTCEGPGGVRFWPGGMQPGQKIDVSTDVLMLHPGKNQITFSAEGAKAYSGDVNLLLYRLEPL
jgi:hypothetical protein